MQWNVMGVDPQDAFLAGEDNKLASWLLLCNNKSLKISLSRDSK